MKQMPKKRKSDELYKYETATNAKRTQQDYCCLPLYACLKRDQVEKSKQTHCYPNIETCKSSCKTELLPPIAQQIVEYIGENFFDGPDASKLLEKCQ